MERVLILGIGFVCATARSAYWYVRITHEYLIGVKHELIWGKPKVGKGVELLLPSC